MADTKAPNPPRLDQNVIDPRTGGFTQQGYMMMQGIWRQIAAGFVIVPCTASTTANLITLTPKLHEEGAAAYGDYMTFAFVADASVSGVTTAKVQTRAAKALATIKVYASGGSAQATTGDIVATRLYLAIYNSALDGGAGGLVIK